MKKTHFTIHILWITCLRLLLMSTLSVQGKSIWDSYLPSSLSNVWKLVDMGTKSESPLTDLILGFVDQFREGLREAKGDHLPVPDFKWIIDGGKLNGVIRTHNLTVSGFPEFKVKNLTTSVMRQMGDIRVEFPLLDVHGDFDLAANAFGPIPIWGHGKVSIKLINLNGGFGAHLKGPSSSSSSSVVHVSNPKLTLQGIHISLDGFMGNLQLWHVVLIGLSAILMIAAISVGLTVSCMKTLKRKIVLRRHSSYRAVLEL